MSLRGRNKTVKNPYAKINEKNRPSIAEYCDKILEWRLWPAKIVDGKMFIEFHGYLISNDEFLKYQPMPKVENFRRNINNIDSRVI